MGDWLNSTQTAPKFRDTTPAWSWLGTLFTLLVCAGAASMAFCWQYRQRHKSLRLPPGPQGLPLFGNLGMFLTSSHIYKMLDGLSKQYGPVMYLRLGKEQAVVVSSPDIARVIFRSLDKEFASRPYYTSKDHLGYGDGNSMGLSVYGPGWKTLRRITSLELLSQKHIRRLQNVREEEISRMVKSILEDTQTINPVVDMSEKLKVMLMNTMGRSLFGARIASYTSRPLTKQSDAAFKDAKHSEFQEEELAAETAELGELLGELFFLLGVFLIKDFLPSLGFLDRIMNYKGRMDHFHGRMDSLLTHLIAARRRHHKASCANPKESFLDVLLSLPGEDGAQALDEIIIKGMLLDLLAAGSDTLLSAVEWGLSELLLNEQVMEKVQLELDSVVGRARLVTEPDVLNLPFLQAVVKESFRLHPVAPLLLPHLNTETCRLAGYDIPAGTTTFINAWSITRSPEVWDNPLQFRPERFLNSGTDVRGQHCELLIFGAGRRICPGLHLSLAVVPYTLARLVQALHWKLPQGQTLDMSDKPGLKLCRDTPLMAAPHARLSPDLYEHL